VRFFILSSHYRSPLNYSNENLAEAHAALTRLYTAMRGLVSRSNQYSEPEATEEYIDRFEEAMDDDFNTPVAISILFELAREANRLRTPDQKMASGHALLLRGLGHVLGLLQDDPEIFLQGETGDADELTTEAIEGLIQQRLDARQNKNWDEADRIRLLLKEQGIVLEDNASGTLWRREGLGA
jgi:cysteinyl-tRNA synthetase